MTTTVKVHVDGNYRATVKRLDADGKILETQTVEPQEEKSFSIYHSGGVNHSIFDITEEYLGAKPT